MWVLTSIDANHFNVISDLMGQVSAAVLLFAVSIAYPCIVWETMKRGRGVSPNGVLAPPASPMEYLERWRGGDPRWLLLLMVTLSLVATLSHAASDVFLDFISVPVSTREGFFLGTEPSWSIPTYRALAEPTVEVWSTDSLPAARLLSRIDDIAQGLSRFSIIPPRELAVVEAQNVTFLGGNYSVWRSYLSSEIELPPDLQEHQYNASAIPATLQVECKDSDLPENTVDEAVYVRDPSAVDGSYTNVLYNRSIPDCAYEAIAPREVVLEDASETTSNRWEVLDWSHFTLENGWRFGSRDGLGEFHPDVLSLNANETSLSIAREDWWKGRRIRDGLSLFIGGDDDKLEMQVEESVVAGYKDFSSFGFPDVVMYTVSSWSRSCPALDELATLSVVDYSEPATSSGSDPAAASGCLIDTQIVCSRMFQQDRHEEIEDGAPSAGAVTCGVNHLSVTTLAGLEVDPVMLAAYSRMGFRNGGLNVYTPPNDHPIAVNSIAAAYIMTRKIVRGTADVEGVRASIEPPYIFFMLLPVIVALPLFLLQIKGASPPVPQTAWHMMVLGRGEEDAVNPHPCPGRGDVPYPTCPKSAKLGIVRDNRKGCDRLGIGSKVIPLERQLGQGSDRRRVTPHPPLARALSV